jgi:hypothetical protein
MYTENYATYVAAEKSSYGTRIRQTSSTGAARKPTINGAGSFMISAGSMNRNDDKSDAYSSGFPKRLFSRNILTRKAMAPGKRFNGAHPRAAAERVF